MNKRCLIKRFFSPCFLKTGIQRDHHRYQVMTDQSSCLRFLPRMAATASSDSSLCSPPHSPGRNCQPELSLAWCLISSAPPRSRHPVAALLSSLQSRHHMCDLVWLTRCVPPIFPRHPASPHPPPGIICNECCFLFYREMNWR